MAHPGGGVMLLALLVVAVAVALYDVTQRRHAILRNFPIIGHFRYLLESVGPELRQYIVTNNDEERPFSRDQRSWIYASAKRQNEYKGFGSDNEMELAPNYLIIKHAAFPLGKPRASDDDYNPGYEIPCAKILGGPRRRAKAFRPASVVNVSAMSFGALSGRAVEALNHGCRIAGCLHNTGEGGVSRYHRLGGEIVWQIGTGYFGCRERNGAFSMTRFLETLERNPQIRAIELKLSQGAKPGVGGILPAAKVTDEIAEARGVPLGQDCLSPPAHSAFGDADSLLDFVERLADASGLPVGIKSAVGEMDFWNDLAARIRDSGRSVDFVTIDGGEGGTGAGPLVFSDHVAAPFKLGFARVYRTFAQAGIHEQVAFIGSGRLGFPESALFAFALGCDMVNVAREAMLAIGCIQAQRCHTNRCPTGVATHSRWLVRGLDPELKSARLANYVVTLRKELLRLSRACGVVHPALVSTEHFDILDGHFGAKSIGDVFGYEAGLGLPSDEDQRGIADLMTTRAARRAG